MTGFSPATAALILQRDGGCARCGDQHLGQRGIDYDLHHRRPRGMGGTKLPWVNQPANGVTLCRSCHTWVESNRAEAYDTGWLVRRNSTQTPNTVPIVHAVYGWGFLDDTGGFTPDNPYKEK